VEDPDQRLRGVVMPVSEALMTDFDEEFFRLLAKRSFQDAVATPEAEEKKKAIFDQMSPGSRRLC